MLFRSEVCSCSIGFVCVGPGLDEFFFKVVVNCFIQSGRSGNGQDPVLCTLFPFVEVQAAYVGEGVGDFLPWVHHDRVRGIHKLVETEFVKKAVGLLSVSVENRGFFSLEGFLVS